MAKTKKLISIDEDLLERIDAHADETGQNRSQWLESAALARLHSDIDIELRSELTFLVEAYLKQR